MSLYKNRYRIESARNQDWHYGWDGAYFITICTHDREHFFGKIDDGEMQLSNVGTIADVFWHEIKNHAKNVKFDAFVVMPNHIHGVLILTGNDAFVNPIGAGCVDSGYVETGHALSDSGYVETGHALSLREEIDSNDPFKTIGQQRFGNQGRNTISSIVGSYKSAVTKHARRLGNVFQWQTRFHDHIIRDADEFNRIVNYINTNPQHWKEDLFYHRGTDLPETYPSSSSSSSS